MYQIRSMMRCVEQTTNTIQGCHNCQNVDLAFLLQTCDHLKYFSFGHQDHLLNALQNVDPSKVAQLIKINISIYEPLDAYYELLSALPQMIPNLERVRVVDVILLYRVDLRMYKTFVLLNKFVFTVACLLLAKIVDTDERTRAGDCAQMDNIR